MNHYTPSLHTQALLRKTPSDRSRGMIARQRDDKAENAANRLLRRLHQHRIGLAASGHRCPKIKGDYVLSIVCGKTFAQHVIRFTPNGVGYRSVRFDQPFGRTMDDVLWRRSQAA